MARGAHVSPPAASSLPKVEFEVINDEKLKLPGGIHDQQARNFGYNDYAEFRRPEYYIRHIEPLESDLAKTVEYDMDEHDQEWLDAVNAERMKVQIGKISQENFEIIMDRLEKEWFDLTKNIPKPDFAMPSEDSTCAICDDSEGENSNAIVFCDGCNLAVHQDCYGVPYIPEGQWLCRKCTVSPENPVECILCPNEGGAFKQTVHGEWVHLLCAIWIPETRVANDVFMEPVTGIEKISKQRWKLRCTICDVREGACIQCTKPSCFVAFHATCARKDKLLMPMKSAHGAEPASLTCFCDRHLPQEQQDARAAALLVDESHQRTGPNTQLSKSARAYAKTYKPGPPLVPHVITERILKYISRMKIRKKTEAVWQLCRYWSLKREARRGAPLLKRLHLEPWTAAAGTKVLTEEEKLMRLDQLIRLRQDLINVQNLNTLVRTREYRKLRQTEIIYEVLSQALFPSHAHLRTAFEKITAIDRNDYFRNPVSKSDVPDYFEIVKNPMSWTEIDAKLDKHQYWDLQAFRDDIELVVDNALLYNKAGTPFHKAAGRVKKEANTLLNLLEPWKLAHPPHAQPPHAQPLINGHASRDNDDGDNDSHSAAAEMPPPLGDFEPPLDVLDLLMSSDLIKEDLNMELDADPVTTLLNYELARVKPAPPDAPSPPAAPPPQRKKKGKRDKKAEAERFKASKEATERESAAARVVELDKEDEEEAERARAAAAAVMGDEENGELDELEKEHRRELYASLDGSAGLRAPRTRGGMAAAAAFEAEAHGTTPISGSSSISIPPSAGPSRPPDSTDKSHWKRPSITSMSQTSIPRVVNDVDNRDSFSMFNAGWILPPDQKRGGRVPADRPALPPPRKRQKTDHGSSRLSNVSTAPSDNYTLRRTPPWSSDPPDIKHEVGIPMDVDGPPSQNPIPPSASRKASPVNEAITNLVTQPNGVVIIEQLDTPAIRREKHMRRKAEKQRLAGVAASAPVSVDSSGNPPLPPPTSGVSSFASPPRATGGSVAVSQPLRPPPPEVPREQLLEDFDSELSELSDDETDADAHGEPDDEIEDEITGDVAMPPPAPSLPAPPPMGPLPKEPPPRKKSNRKKVPKLKGEPFEDGTIVWAKSESFPWWPAVVHADMNEMVPGNILIAHRDKRLKRKIKLYIVQFYDKTSSWASVAKDKLQYLGEDRELDEDLLSNSTKQKWKSSASKQMCREAYKRALSEMDMEEGGYQHLDMSEDGDAGED